MPLFGKGWTCALFFAMISAFMGMVQFGFNTGVINVPESKIKAFIRDVHNATSESGAPISESTVKLIWSFAVSIFAIGGMFGAIFGGKVGDSLGRKRGLLVNNSIAIVGGLLMSCSKLVPSYIMLIIGRFVIGINCGANTVLVPLYLSEISPVGLRGGLGTVNQLGVTIGLLISQILGLDFILGTDAGWPYLLGFALVFPIIQLVTLPFCPETPRYLLISQNQEVPAVKALTWLRGGQSHAGNIKMEVEEMRKEAQEESKEAKISILQLLRTPFLRVPLAIGVMMHLSQQLTGINAVFYYSTKIFKEAGLDEHKAASASTGVGAIMVVMTFITIPLMDRLGRRALHLSGLSGMLSFSILLTLALLFKSKVAWLSGFSVAMTLLFVMFFAIGPGTIPWMIVPELFSQGPRPAAISIVVVVNWLANFTVGLAYPHMEGALKEYSFVPFIVLLVLFVALTYKYLPETKNKTFAEITAHFRKGYSATSEGPIQAQVHNGEGDSYGTFSEEMQTGSMSDPLCKKPAS